MQDGMVSLEAHLAARKWMRTLFDDVSVLDAGQAHAALFEFFYFVVSCQLGERCAGNGGVEATAHVTLLLLLLRWACHQSSGVGFVSCDFRRRLTCSWARRLDVGRCYFRRLGLGVSAHCAERADV